MDYLKRYQKMISLRGLTDHTMKSYQTYLSAYLAFVENTLHKIPSQVSYKEQRRFLEVLQKERNLSDRTMNVAISQLRFFTLYVLHKPWDDTQLPMRKFDTYLPFVPTKAETKIFISTMTDIKPKAMVALMYSSGLRIGEVCNLRYEDIQRKTCAFTSLMVKIVLIVMPFSLRWLLISLPSIGLHAESLPAISFLNSTISQCRLIPFISPDILQNTSQNSDGPNVLPVIPSGMLLVHTSMKMVLIL